MTLHFILQSAAALLLSMTQPNGDAIPDFSMVGYHHSEAPIPEVATVGTLEAPADGSDALALIQGAIDGLTGPGAILMKAGTYNVSGTINLNKSGVVLRGEGPSTVLLASFREQKPLIILGMNTRRSFNQKAKSQIKDKYTPVGQMWVKVQDNNMFKAGDRVCLVRPGTEEWIHDLRMDRIPGQEGRKLTQWKPEEYDLFFEREVVKAEGNKVWLDAPVVMALDSKYGGGELICCSVKRITESGIESMKLVSVFNDSIKDEKGRWTDEAHAWEAVKVTGAENCWIRGLESWYFGYSLVSLSKLTRLCTVDDCHVNMPVSQVTGGRRYGLGMSQCELCLVKDSSVDNDRHGCVTGARTCGPNVFLRCKGTNMWSDFGPHHRWATGVLYDNVTTDYQFNIQDRENWGSGHGWAGANFVMWNCNAASLACQNPWVSAQNWIVGCTGEKSEYSKKGVTFLNSTRSHGDGLQRPSALFYSHGSHVAPASLYEYQLQLRLSL